MTAKRTKRGSMAELGLQKLLDTKYNWRGGPGGYDAFVRYVEAGMNDAQIAPLFEVTPPTVWGWRKQYNQEKEV